MTPRFPEDDRFELVELIKRQVAERLKLIDTSGEQLGQRGLGAMDPEPLLEQLQLLGRENGWIRRLITFSEMNDRLRHPNGRLGCRGGENKRQAQDQGSAALHEFAHEPEAGLC